MKQNGQIVGYTRSRKPIYAFWMDEARNFPHPGNLGFLDDDHFDAYVVFDVLVFRTIRRYGKDSSEVDFYKDHSRHHLDAIFSILNRLMTIARCHDAFDLAKLGRQLCNPEFKDL